MVIKKMTLTFFACLNLVIYSGDGLPTNEQPKEKIFLTLEEAEKALEEIYNILDDTQMFLKKTSILSKEAFNHVVTCANYPEKCTKKYYFMPDDVLEKIDPALVKDNPIIPEYVLYDESVQNLYDKNAMLQLRNEIKADLKESDSDRINLEVNMKAIERLVREGSLICIFLRAVLVGKSLK